MTGSRLYKIFAALILLSMLAAAATFLTSFRFNPDRSGDASFIARAQQKVVPGIKVSASALGARESEQSFGENLAERNIQPLWLSIENDTDDNSLTCPLRWILTIIHLTKSLISSTAPCLSPSTARVTSSFLNDKLRAFSPLTRKQQALRTVLRAVIFLSNQTTPIEHIERLPWDIPPLSPEEAH
jgi:hypothetical protein